MIRLYVEDALWIGQSITLSTAYTHYLYTVMRLKAGDCIEVFNGRDGGWYAECLGKHIPKLHVQSQLYPQPHLGTTLHLYVSGFKRMDWTLEKATELGVTHIHLVHTQHSSVRHLSIERSIKILREASEQSQRYTVPEILPFTSFHQALEDTPPAWIMHLTGWETQRASSKMRNENAQALWVGPEGGWSPQELSAFEHCEHARSLCFPGLCLRAETAVVAGLAYLHKVMHPPIP